MRARRPTFRPNAAFTLLEVILAVTIFGLTMIALTAVMRTGARSWSIGHALAELMQTARVSQDVIVRDLNNITYRNETDYNETFRSQIERIGSEVLARSPHDPLNPYRSFDASQLSQFEPGQRGRRDNTSITFDQITPPIDLSFRGSAERLSFVRRQSTGWAEAESAWGLRRITYYVKDKVLYREESDPFGFRPGAGLMGFVSSLNPEFNPLDAMDASTYNRQTTAAPTTPLGQITQYFASPDENSDDDTGRGQYLPASIHYCEPVCEGVEAFKIAYGYFLEGDWVEVANWDSNVMQNRSPFDREYFQELYDKGLLNMNAIGNSLGTTGRTGSISDSRPPSADTPYKETVPVATNMMSQSMNMPDNLPGYVAIQITVRSPSLKGTKAYTFTIFHSMPLAEETDVRIDEESLMARMDDNYRNYADRKNRRASGSHSSTFTRGRSRRY